MKTLIKSIEEVFVGPDDNPKNKIITQSAVDTVNKMVEIYKLHRIAGLPASASDINLDLLLDKYTDKAKDQLKILFFCKIGMWTVPNKNEK